MSVPELSWRDLPHGSFECDPSLLDLRPTFDCGQAFRWRQDPEGWWMGVAEGSALRVRADGATVTYAAYPGLPRADFWADYLRLDFDLAGMYRELEGAEPHLDAAFERWRGLRLLRQDPMETTTSFLCTTANSIPRITRAIDRMCRRWGQPIARIDGEEHHAFPEPGVFTEPMAGELERLCGLGYRAHNLVRAMEEIAAKPPDWAGRLRVLPYSEARAELMGVPGIGPKLADCISLFALDKDEAVPVDTHVRQIAVELYFPELGARSLTTNTYNRIAEYFRELFGWRAGWAQQYLFLWHLRRHREPPVL